MKRTMALLLASSMFAGCTNHQTHRDFHRSGPVAEGRRPPGLYGDPNAPPAFIPQPVPEHLEQQQPLLAEPRSVAIVSASRGGTIAWQEFVSELAAADIIILGEIHGQRQAHSTMAALFEDLLAQAPTAWLSLEFFDRDNQTALDDYLAGVTSETEFLTASRRDDANYPAGHRAMVETARRLGRPVIAASAPRRYARIARTEGFEKLTALGADQQRLFVVPASMTQGRYRSDFEEQMRRAIASGGHASAPDAASASSDDHAQSSPLNATIDARIEGYYRAQNLWDATMADSIVRPALAGARPIIHVVGQFHSDFAGGLVERLRADAQDRQLRTVSFVDRPPDSAGGLSAEDVGRADFVLHLRAQ